LNARSTFRRRSGVGKIYGGRRPGWRSGAAVPDAAFYRVLAAHLLYHVPDRQAALHELRRSFAPGGRVVLATNGSNY